MPGERDKTSGFSWRFSLRSLFLWALIVGLAVGWWVDHHRLTNLPPWIAIVDSDSDVAYYVMRKLEQAGIEARGDAKRRMGKSSMEFGCSVRVRSSDYERAVTEIETFWRDAYTKPPGELLREPLSSF